MSAPLDAPLRDPLLDALGIAHGFGQRETTVPSDAGFPKQVHGIAVHEHRVGVDPRVTRGLTDAWVRRCTEVLTTPQSVRLLLDGDLKGSFA